jgi:ferredoxin, 2Fe-2S
VHPYRLWLPINTVRPELLTTRYASPMVRIRILPLDVEIEAAPEATVMAAAQALGYYWPTTCGGEARCTTCACEVVEGAAALTPMGRAEERALVTERGPRVLETTVRLACQARVRDAAGQITLKKPGVRPPLT